VPVLLPASVLTLPSIFLYAGNTAFMLIIIDKKIDLDAMNRSVKFAYIDVFVLHRLIASHVYAYAMSDSILRRIV
jgi:hypothetical protein